jgi:hypothetical protein
MSAITGQLSAARLKTIGFWALKLVLAALFLFAGGAKLAGLLARSRCSSRWPRAMVPLFHWRLGSGASCCLWPVTTALGALILMIVSIGAALAQLLVLHEDVIHAIVLAVPLAAIAWFHRDQLGGLGS